LSGAQTGDVDDHVLSGDATTPSTQGFGSLATTRPKYALWVKISTVFLFILFIAYYQILLFAIVKLCDLAVSLEAGPWSVLTRGLIVLLVIRLAFAICTGIVALVSNRCENNHGRDHELEATVPQTKQSAPQLFALIADVGRQIHAPLPDHVLITPRAECYVLEQRRFALSTNRELTLVLGLPHLGVLSTTELRVIIAHELAHFRSGDTRLGVFLYRFLESLRTENQQMQRRIAWIDPVSWYRWLYFHVSYLLAAPIFKHQELHADSVSASVHGGELTARTLLREWLLAHQFESLLDSYRQTHPEPLGRKNLFEEFGRRFRSFSPAAHDYLRERLTTVEASSLFDSHPTMQDRCETVASYPAREVPKPQLGCDLLPDLAKLQQKFHDQLVLC
jgi:Zn-dependent protease with chaperone function